MIGQMLAWVRRRRRRIEAELVTVGQRRELSPVFYAQAEVVLPLLQRYAHGRLIDLGCGSAPFWPDLVDRVDVYHGMDLWPRSEHTSFAGDIQNLAMVRDSSYDSAMCIEVLEHVPDPFAAVASLARVLRPGGVAVISVPHLSRLHDLPHDYFRFTEYGLRVLLARAGLEVVGLHVKGGIFSFLGHQLATVLMVLAWSLPPLRRPLLWVNQWGVTRPCVLLDRLISTATTFPQGYVVVARKPDSGVEQGRA